MNPVVIKLPDGTLNIGTESKDRQIKEVLCWNCKSRLLYKHTFNQIICYSCHEVVDTSVNNNPDKVFVKCLNCEQDLLVPSGAFKIYCSNCSNLFTISK